MRNAILYRRFGRSCSVGGRDVCRRWGVTCDGVLVASGVLNGEVDLVSVDIIEHTMARVRVDSTFEESHHQDYSERRRIKEAR